MIDLILTNTVDSKYILNRIKGDYNRKSKFLVIVPDRIVLSYEMMVLEHLGIKGAFNIEVASFSRLADLVLKNKAHMMLNAQSSMILIRKVIEDNKEKLLFYKNAASYTGFAKEMLNVINLIRNNSVTMEMLNGIIDKLPIKYQNKTKDILLIYREYVTALRSDYIDDISKLEALRDEFKDSDYSDYRVYVSEFFEFSKIELDIIFEMMKISPYISIGLPYSNNDNSNIFPNELKAKFEDYAKVAGVGINVLEEHEDLLPEFEVLQKNLYSYKPNISRQPIHNVEINFAINPEQEVKNLAIKISNIIKNDKLRYNDIACICGDIPNYLTTIQSVFSRYEIPFYADSKSLLAEQNLSKLLLMALKVVISGYNQADVLTFMKEADSIFSNEEIDSFENYCLKYGIDYSSRFKSDFMFGEEQERSAMQSIRKKFIDLLTALENKESISVNDYISDIKDFLDKIDAAKICEDFADLQERKGYKVESKVTRQVYDKIEIVLQEMKAMLGTCVMSFAQFYKILDSTISTVKISTVPMYIDCVYIGDCEKSRYQKKKYIFVIGANDSCFPPEHSDVGILTLQEFGKWNELGVSIYPTVRESNRSSRLIILMDMIKPVNGLSISYSLYDTVGNELQPSRTIAYIKELLSIEEEIMYCAPDETASENDLLNYFVSRKNALEDLIQMRDLIESGVLNITEPMQKTLDVLYRLACEDCGKDRVDKILNGGYNLEDTLDNDFDTLSKKNISVSLFEKYFNCPFAYYADYILKLKEREISGEKVRDTGIIMHAVMELFFKLPNWEKLDDIEIFVKVEEIISDYIDNDNREFQYLFEPEFAALYSNLLNAVSSSVCILSSRMKKTKFRPYKTEAAFGKGKDGKAPDYPAIEIYASGHKYNFVGVVDRIDKYKNQAIIIDYKSKSSINFDITNIIYGDRIQLIMYLKMLMDNENITPAGVYYLLINNKIVSESNVSKRLQYIGFTANDIEIISNIDEDFLYNETYESDLYPISKKKDSYKANKGSILLSSANNFKKICEYVVKLIQKAADEIEKGYIAVSPLGTKASELPHGCMYCNYKSICNIENNLQSVRIAAKLEKSELAKMFGDIL